MNFILREEPGNFERSAGMGEGGYSEASTIPHLDIQSGSVEEM